MIDVKEQMPGLSQARYVQGKIKELGILDVELYYDPTIEPHGMWAVCQVYKPSKTILLLRDTTIDTKPGIMYWCKTNDGHFRVPNDQDISDVVAIVNRAQVLWAKGGDWMEDRFIEQDQKKDEAHNQKFKDMIHSIAPDMKKAIKSGSM